MDKQVSWLQGKVVFRRREAESETSPKEAMLQSKSKEYTSHIWKSPKGFQGPRQDNVRFAVVQKVTASLSRTKRQVPKQEVTQLFSHQTTVLGFEDFLSRVDLVIWGMGQEVEKFLNIRANYSMSKLHQQALCTSLPRFSFFLFKSKTGGCLCRHNVLLLSLFQTHWVLLSFLLY